MASLGARTFASGLMLYIALACSSIEAHAAAALVDEARAVEGARRLYLSGTALVKAARWSDALAAFQRSNAQHPHPITTYNIGACARSLGRYDLAASYFARALAMGDERARLPGPLHDDAEEFVRRLPALRGRLELLVEPGDALVSVDGDLPTSLDAARVLVLDPGEHNITVLAPGHAAYRARIAIDSGRLARLHVVLDPTRVASMPWPWIAPAASLLFGIGLGWKTSRRFARRGPAGTR